MLLVSINESFDRRTVDLLLAIRKAGRLYLTGGECAPLLASDMVTVTEIANGPIASYVTELNAKGTTFVDGWLAGDQEAAIP